MNSHDLERLLDGQRIVAITGGQWGDEGKGKIVDLFSGWAHVVARGTGGANAGHTIEANGQHHVVHLVPSGILHDQNGVATICGNGMVIDPKALLDELTSLETAGITHQNFRLAYNAGLVIPPQILLDRLREKQAGRGKIGTTGRGIGPAYADRVSRIGLIVNDLLNPDLLAAKLTRNLEEKSRLMANADADLIAELLSESGELGRCYRIGHGFDTKTIVDQYLEYGDQLASHIDDTDRYLRDYAADGETRILLEGAQGELLGVNGGTYPFVTSSDCSLVGLATGVGLNPRQVDLTVVVAKAFYMTRVGAGPFPTEMGGETSARSCNDPCTTRTTEQETCPDATVNDADPYRQGVGIRQVGNEYGATTGRPRRTGWLDLLLLKHTLRRTGGKILLALTKLDVLDDCREIKLCIGYHYTGPPMKLGQRELQVGTVLEEAVVDASVLEHCKPVYHHYHGWQSSTVDCRTSEDLPTDLSFIVGIVEDYTQTKVGLISVGPDRDQTILMD